MTSNPQFKFDYEKDLTNQVYNTLALKFENKEIKEYCYPLIIKAVSENELDLGIDFEKPWEELVMDNYYQIEYLFFGSLSNGLTQVNNEQIGINIIRETRFGMEEFGSNEILNLTFIIDKL